MTGTFKQTVYDLRSFRLVLDSRLRGNDGNITAASITRFPHFATPACRDAASEYNSRMFQPFFVALTALLSVLCVIVCGIVLRRTGRISSETDQGLLRINIDLLMPCLIMDLVLKSDAFSNPQNLWLPPIIGFTQTAIGILCGFAVVFLPSHLTGLTTWPQKRTFAGCVGLLNYGFVPIPIVAALFPGDLGATGVLFLAYLGGEASLWVLVVFCMMGKCEKNFWRHLINGPILAILISVPLNLLFRGGWIPAAWMESTGPVFTLFIDCLFGSRGAIHWIGQASIPMSLIVIGLTISGHLHRANFKKRLPRTLRIAVWSCLIRLVIMPAICLAAAVFLPLTMDIRKILVVYGAMGSAIFPIVLARFYQGDTETALDTVMANTLVSIVTLPIWISVGLRLIQAA